MSPAMGHGTCKVEIEEVKAQVCAIELTKVCGAEKDGKIIFQYIGLETVCVDIVSKICLPATVPEDGCTEVTQKACIPSHKIVDVPALLIPAVLAVPEICRLVPKGKCEAKVALTVPKTVCEPVGLPKLIPIFGVWGK